MKLKVAKDAKKDIEESIYKRFISKKEILLTIIKEKGNCITIVCENCPLYPDCGYNMFDDDNHYNRALKKYVEEFGETNLIESLL